MLVLLNKLGVIKAMLLVIRKVSSSLQMLNYIFCDEAIMQENQSGTVYEFY